MIGTVATYRTPTSPPIRSSPRGARDEQMSQTTVERGVFELALVEVVATTERQHKKSKTKLNRYRIDIYIPSKGFRLPRSLSVFATSRRGERGHRGPLPPLHTLQQSHSQQQQGTHQAINNHEPSRRHCAAKRAGPCGHAARVALCHRRARFPQVPRPGQPRR